MVEIKGMGAISTKGLWKVSARKNQGCIELCYFNTPKPIKIHFSSRSACYRAYQRLKKALAVEEAAS